MKQFTAIAAALMLMCAVLGGCKSKKEDTVKPTTAPATTATVRPDEKKDPTPSPLLDTDKTIDDAKDKLDDMADDVKDGMHEAEPVPENDLDAGVNVGEGAAP